jgi:hypothetical protein
MASRDDLEAWLEAALRANGGRAKIPEVCKLIWEDHKDDLLSSGDLLYTWQYDVRWAANRLRRRKIMKAAEVSPNGVWELVN